MNVDECQVLQVVTRDKRFDYKTSKVKLKSIQYVKDFGVKIVSNLKFS